MIGPAEEIYIIYDRVTESIKTGGGSSTKPSVHAYMSENEAWKGVKRIGQPESRSGVAKYVLVEAKENRE
mgnify:CR=1 FL=1